MNSRRRKRLEEAGFKVGTASEFLGLSEAEARYVDLKVGLSSTMAARRHELGVTQATLARQLESSQSRVAKMEAGDQSVSLDLLVRALFLMGVSSSELAETVRGTPIRPARRVGPRVPGAAGNQRATRRYAKG